MCEMSCIGLQKKPCKLLAFISSVLAGSSRTGRVRESRSSLVGGSMVTFGNCDEALLRQWVPDKQSIIPSPQFRIDRTVAYLLVM